MFVFQAYLEIQPAISSENFCLEMCYMILRTLTIVNTCCCVIMHAK